MKFTILNYYKETDLSRPQGQTIFVAIVKVCGKHFIEKPNFVNDFLTISGQKMIGNAMRGIFDRKEGSIHWKISQPGSQLAGAKLFFVPGNEASF